MIEPMAERLGVDPQGLRQFVSDSPWSEQAVWTLVRQKTSRTWSRWGRGRDRLAETGSALGRRVASILRVVGKQAYCQVSVELVVSNGEIAAPIGGRLYLPETWTKDPAR